MPETMFFSFQLTKELWQVFFAAHYSQNPSLKTRYLWGITCLVIGCLGFGGFYESNLVASLMLATGFFGVLSKQILVLKSLRAAVRHPFFGKELTVAVSPQELSVRSGMAGYSQPWSNFSGYRSLAPGFLFYHDHNAFFFLPSAVITAKDSARLLTILEAAEVTEL